MRRIVAALAAGFLFAFSAAAADGPVGSWKLALPGNNLTFLVKFEQKDGKWTPLYLGASVAGVPKLAMSDLSVAPDQLKFSLKLPGRPDLVFDGKLPADAKNGRISGSLMMGAGQMVLVQLVPSKMNAFDRSEFNKETLEQSTDVTEMVDAAIELLTNAADSRAKIEEVRGWADKVYKQSEPYGIRWQRMISTRLAQAVAGQKDFNAVAVEYARKAERLLSPDDEPAVQMEVLEAVAQVLTKSDKASDAKQLLTQLAKLEELDYADYQKRAPFKADPFEGRKGKSDRAVLVELFTGAECPPCVAADVAFDGLSKTYKPSEVILLQYHIHVPGPDPLTSPDSMARLQYYGRKITGAPTMFFNGKIGPPPGGPLQAGRKKYVEFREVIEPMLEKDAEGKIDLTAERKGDEVAIKASVTNLARSGDSIRIRFVLAESHVRYTGGNGMRYHHFVVRSFPGGVKGVPLKNKSGEASAAVKLEEVRAELAKYLDDFSKNEEAFPRPDRPLALKNLRVIGFVQDDETNEILQAAQVELK